MVIALLVFLVSGPVLRAQTHDRQDSGYMEYFIEGKDTVYVDLLEASKIISRLPRQKGKDWRKYYRLVYNFSKVYPYAKVSRVIIARADSTISADHLRRAKKEKFLDDIQKELFNVFEEPMKKLTINQGRLLMKLIDRECGITSYQVIKDYRNGIAAGFWQGVAKLFGSDLKAPYDPEGDDALVEDLVDKWETGEFEGFYFRLFWEYPKKVSIPSKYM